MQGDYAVLSILGLLAELLIIYSFSKNIRNVSADLKEALSFIVPATGASFIVLAAIPEYTIAGLVGQLIFIILMTAVANRKVKILPLSILYAMFTTVILLWSTHLTNLFLDFLTVMFPAIGYLGRDEVTGNCYWKVLYLGLIYITGNFISRQTGRYLHKRIQLFDSTLKRKLAVYLLFSAVVTLGLFLVNTFLTDALQNVIMYSLLYAVILTICFIALAFAVFAFTDSLRKEIELKHNAELLHNLEKYTQHVETMATEVRQFRHDHKNLMVGFFTHIENRNWAKLENYYSLYMSDFSAAVEAVEICMDKLSNIHPPELKTILFMKFSQIQRLGVKIIIEVEGTVTLKGDKNLLDVFRVVGILMDNAMEACAGVIDAEIRLLGCMSNGGAYFVFQNTCSDPPPINKIGKKGFSTKGEGRGLGLHNVSQLIRKNKCLVLQTKIRDGKFTQELLIMPGD